MTRNRFHWLLVLAIAPLGCFGLAAAESPPAPALSGTLQIDGGDSVAGRMCDCDQPGILRWQGAAFEDPFDFELAAVSIVHFSQASKAIKAKGDYCIELQGGDVLFGSLVELTAEEARLDVPPFGPLRVQREHVRSIVRWRDGADLVYAGANGLPETDLVYEGPNGLTEWDREQPQGAWRQEADFLTTEKTGASLAGDFHLPPQAIVEFELSWTTTPDFLLVLGTQLRSSNPHMRPKSPEREEAFCLEVWDDDLVLFRETDKEADLASLGKVADGPGRCHMVVYLDQQRNRATVFSYEGELLGELAVSESTSRPLPCIRLVNRGGKVRLEQLRVMRWDGAPPREVQGDKPRVHRADGSVVYGKIHGFDTATSEFLIGDDGQAERVHADELTSVIMSRSDAVPPTGVRAILQDGARISGELRKLENGRLHLSRPGVAEPLAIPVSKLKTLLSLDNRKPASNTDGRVGRLTAENTSSRGCLVDGDQPGGADCLAWKPLGSATASPLTPGTAAQIVYRASPRKPALPQASPQAHPPRPARRAQPAPGGGVLGVLARALAGNAPNPPSTRSQPVMPRAAPSTPGLYLRTGDVIPCKVEQIDERGVTFESSAFDATFVSHDKIKAIELENRSLATRIDKPSRDRLMMLPRMQKDNPPTHLIRSPQGDYLRARLIELNDETLTVEVRLETRKLPRKHVTRIIWLGEETADRPVAAEADGNEAPKTRVQALRDDGIRLTFFAEKLTGTSLEGTSDVLGPCRVELDEVDQLMIGGAIEQAAADLPYQRWKLQDAPQPKFVQSEGEEGGTTAGTESALVGKPAPDFQLEMLDGSRFRLSDQQGKVVVLEFWATWCGPCVQTLPQIDRAVKEFEDRGALLVAVNLQETPEAIKALLERLKLETAVALDRTGAVAEKYAAVAIPQTVIVDSTGDVARLFVGGGHQYEQQLREALQSVLSAGDERGQSH